LLVFSQGQTIQADLSENKSQIYIGNLPKDVSPSEFTEFAKQTVGSFMDLQVKSGFAFVVFPNVQAAEKAIESLKQVEFRGRKLNVDFSQSSSSECRVLYIRNIAEITDEHRLR
jgi:RNA recognition motif-containing protein